jgi:pimeloyl-ACP methyl ester carboxylesterase
MLFRSAVNDLTRCLLLAGCLASPGLSGTALAASPSPMSAGRGYGLDGTWVGTYQRQHLGPAFVAIRIDESQATPQINVSIRSQRIAGARATRVVANRGRLDFEIGMGRNAERGTDWHFDLQQTGERLDGRVELRPGPDGASDASAGSFSLRLQRARDLKLDQFRAFVGNYRLAKSDQGSAAEPGAEADVFFVGYGSSPANRGNSDYAYVTLGDRFQQIVPIGPDSFLADDGARLAFDRDADKKVKRLRWTAALSATELPAAKPPAPEVAERVELWREEQVSFDGPGATLSGSVYTPTAQGPHPALVFVHGSGPQIRLDNWPMADRFARAGIACLSFDKRGTGNSTGDWRQADFDLLADDVVAAVDALRRRPDIRPDQIGLWGVSQAGWVIPVAANKSNHIAFCIPVSGGAVSPAEQELWRRTQYLQFLGCDRRLLEAMRRGVAMHFQWEQLYKAGKFPIPPLFEIEPLDMYLDAPAAIRNVRQPVLAIFGESDVLTPPRESAAIWANQLQAGGNRDHSVRLFPHATHGLLVSDRPFEALPESRLAPGYLNTMLDWIAKHTGNTGNVAPAADKARAQTTPSIALDIAADTPDVIESRGMQQVPWYGSAPVQVTLLLAATLGTLWTLAIWPAAWAIRKFRRMPRRGPPSCKEIVMGDVVNVSALGMCGALLAIMRFLGDASPSPYYTSTEVNLWIIAALTLPIAGFSVLLVRSSIRGAGHWGRTRLEGASTWITAATTCVWVIFFVYWTWGSLLS